MELILGNHTKNQTKMKAKIICVAVALLGLMMINPIEVSAQKGEKTLGVSGGYATYNDGGYANLYFQYSFANHIRISNEIGYVFRNDAKSAFEFSIDMQFPFKIARGFGVYPLVGFTYNNWEIQGSGHASRAGADFGAGFDIYLTSYLKMTIQGKYSVMNDTSGAFFGLGMGYVF